VYRHHPYLYPYKCRYKEGLQPPQDKCLTVVFKRGGGIDLKFESTADRDVWADTLSKIVSQMHA